MLEGLHAADGRRFQSAPGQHALLGIGCTPVLRAPAALTVGCAGEGYTPDGDRPQQLAQVAAGEGGQGRASAQSAKAMLSSGVMAAAAGPPAAAAPIEQA